MRAFLSSSHHFARDQTNALRYAWVNVAITLAGTAFIFRYYVPMFRFEPVLAWPDLPALGRQ
jgi:hypothetical protein